MASGALGPVGSYDNGDGTFTFQMPDGTTMRGGGPVAAQKHAELAGGSFANMPAPSGPIGNALFGGQQPPTGPSGTETASFEVPGFTIPTPKAGAPPPGKPPPDAATAAILGNLASTGGIPQTMKPKAASERGGVAPSDLVGVGNASQANQIPTVMTGGAGGGRVIPGHMQLAQTSTAETKLPEAVKQEFGAANEEKGKAIEQQTAADLEAARQAAFIKNDTAKGLAQYNQGVNEAEARRQAYLSMRMQRIDEANRRLAAMPDEKAPTAGIGGAIAIGLGAIGQGFMAMAGHSTPNVALDIINKKMDQAIAAHRENYAKMKGNLDAEKDAYGFAVQTMGNQHQGELLLKNNYIDDAVRRLDAATADVQSPLIKARATALRGQLLDEKAKNDASFGKIEEHNSYVMTRPQVVGGGAAAPIHDVDVKPSELVKTGRVDASGHPIYAQFGEGATAQKAAEQIASLNQQDADATELSRIVSNPANLADPEARKRASAISARMIEHASKGEGGPSRISKESIDLLERARGGDPNAILSFGKSAGLAEYRAGLESQRQGLLRQHTQSEVSAYREVNPKGEATMRYVRHGFGPQQGPNLAGKETGE